MGDVNALDPVKRVIRFWLFQLGLAAAWVVLWNLSTILEYAPHASLWYPPAALTFAACRHFGLRGIPSVVAAVAVVNFQERIAVESALHFLAFSGATAAAHVLPYLGLAMLMQRVAPQGAQRIMPASVVAFLLGNAIAALAAATLGTAVLQAAGVIGSDEARRILIPWWIGDFAAVMALGPAVITLLGRLLKFFEMAEDRFRPPKSYLGGSGPKGPFLVKLGLCLAMVLLSALIAGAAPEYRPAGFLVFFVIVPQMWIVYSEGPLRSLISIVTLSTFIAVVVWALGLSEHALTYQFALVVVAAAAYFGHTVPMLYAQNRELRELLSRDALTGLVTRVHFAELFEAELERSRRYGESLCLAALDLDEFKAINDRLGHLGGDEVLAAVADCCRTALRASDIVGRIGGDEFLALLPMADLETARSACERLREDVARFTSAAAPELQVTISVGVVAVDPEHDDFEGAFRRADKALYAAKRSGRNRVEAT